MSVEYADKLVNIGQLCREIRALGLPRFQNVHRMIKRRDAGRMHLSDPYLLVECDQLTRAQRQQLDDMMARHQPQAPPAAPVNRRLVLLNKLDMMLANPELPQIRDILTAMREWLS